MAKVLLVEDDVNLREIYAARLQAEGYETSTADDGEKALAVAVKEKPDLIILDVMMPKISGFDVLDILRSTPETKNAKIMMMTALSQDSDKERGEKLGANRYLVKSQVTLEDMLLNAKQLIDEIKLPASDEKKVSPQAEASAEIDKAVDALKTPVEPAVATPQTPVEPVPAPEPTSDPITEPEPVQQEPVAVEIPAPVEPEETVQSQPAEPVVTPQVDTPAEEPVAENQTAQPTIQADDAPATPPTPLAEPEEPEAPAPEPDAPEETVQPTPQAPSTDNDFSTVQTPGTVIQPTAPADDSEPQ